MPLRGNAPSCGGAGRSSGGRLTCEPKHGSRIRRSSTPAVAGRGSLPSMCVLVTGGGGFLGSHLVERLERDGHEVIVSRRREHDLTHYEDAERLFAEAR